MGKGRQRGYSTSQTKIKANSLDNRFGRYGFAAALSSLRDRACSLGPSGDGANAKKYIIHLTTSYHSATFHFSVINDFGGGPKMETDSTYWFEFTEEYTEHRYEMGWLLLAWD